MTTIADHTAILARLASLHPKTIDLSLVRIKRLLAALGHPERHLPPALHVAGTNGKGSTLAFLRAMLEAAGYRAHVYSSPHLVRFNERIRLAGRLIDDGRLQAVLAETEAANAGWPLTFFEATTAAAFLAFAGSEADILLLETGLGGRLDATNVVAPRLCALTPIGLDHQDYLGPTLASIAAEKAGILKPGVAAAVGPQPPEAQAVFDARAARQRLPLHRHGRDWLAEQRGQCLAYRGLKRRLELPLPALPGPHQIDNAGLALACLDLMPEFAVDDAALATGLSKVEWPARLQRLTAGRLPALLPAGSELWLDGGHNPAAAAALARTLEAWQTACPRRLHLVFGMLRRREPASFLAAFAALAPQVWGVPIGGADPGHAPQTLAAEAWRLGLPASACTDLTAALAAIAEAREQSPRVLIAGSLYLAGEVLAANG
ncbi:MAG: bifunctional folylpolyglutamate synthase/dihydrofolate synthase [Alphaproteobacteria bacterium]|nr:bifunctional folylpolyglutamate synthase/dihydrofolate synthase [Alphaproteobacteria bacterium]